MPRCFVKQCKNSDRRRPPGVTFHKIPKSLVREWLEAIGRPADTVIINQRVCSEHFRENDFNDYGQLKTLREGVVPSLNLSASEGERVAGKTATLLTEEWIEKHSEVQQEHEFPKPEVTVLKSTTVRRQLFEPNNEPSTSMERSVKFRTEPDTDPNGDKDESTLKRKMSSSDTASTASSLKRKRTLIRTIHSYSRSPRNYEKQIRAQRRRAVRYQSKLKTAIRTSQRRKRKLDHLSEVITDLRKNDLLSTTALEHVSQSFSGVPQALMKRMLINAKKGTISRKKYPEELRNFAMTLQFYSSRAYEYVRRTFDFALPDQSVIRRWLSKTDCEPGFSLPSLEMLKMKVKEFDESMKNKARKHFLVGALMFDSMSIKKHIEVEPHSLRTRGYTDLGFETNNDDLSPATEALVLMVVGVNSNFKVPVGYFFVNKLTGVEIANLVKEALKLLHTTGIKIVSVTCDGPQAHIQMMKALGCDINDINNLRTHFPHPVSKANVYVILDICHMLKLMRNNWAKLGGFYDPDGNLIEWRFIKLLQEIQEQEGFYLANKLRKKHIDFKKQIMKVNLAAQTLSASVADALEFLATDIKLEEFQNAGPTIKFIRLMNNLFDILNSRSPFGRGFKTPMREENETYWRPFLRNAIDYLAKCVTVEGKQLHTTKNKTPFIGFIISSISCDEIYVDEVKNNKNMKYLLTYKFSQDHLELFFCSVRSRNGWITNPSCLQFVKTYKRLLLHHAVPNTSGNCVAQDQTKILTLDVNKQAMGISDVHLMRLTELQEIEEIVSVVEDLSLPLQLNEYQENVVTYICGYVIRMIRRQFHCPTCLEALVRDETDEILHQYRLIIRKSRGGLLLPSKSLINVCSHIEKIIKLIWTSFRNKLPNHDYVYQILLKEIPQLIMDKSCFPKLEDHILDESPGEEIHKKKLLTLIIKSYSKIRLNSLAKCMNETLSGANVRQTLSRLIIFKNQ